MTRTAAETGAVGILRQQNEPRHFGAIHMNEAAPNREGDVVLAPRKPTEAMIDAGYETDVLLCRADTLQVWDAMVKAALAALQPSPDGVIWDAAPNLGFPTDEPSLRMMVEHYYRSHGMEHWKDMADSYLAALPPVSGGGLGAVAQGALLPTAQADGAVVADLRKAVANVLSAIDLYGRGDGDFSHVEAQAHLLALKVGSIPFARQQAAISAGEEVSSRNDYWSPKTITAVQEVRGWLDFALREEWTPDSHALAEKSQDRLDAVLVEATTANAVGRSEAECTQNASLPSGNGGQDQ